MSRQGGLSRGQRLLIDSGELGEQLYREGDRRQKQAGMSQCGSWVCLGQSGPLRVNRVLGLEGSWWSWSGPRKAVG